MNNKWDFRYEEEVFDDWGENIAGVITNGDYFLFFHVFPHEKDGEPYCHIYNSIWMTDESEECSYKWTSENDETLIEALNGSNGITDIVGDGGLLYQLKFKDSE